MFLLICPFSWLVWCQK